MKKIFSLTLSVTLVLAIFAQTNERKEQKKFRKAIKMVEKRFEKEEKIKKQNQISSEIERETPEKFFQQDYLLTMNKDSLRPTPEVLWKTLEALYPNNNDQIGAMPGLSQTAWVERGPTSVGGRTRALAWDPYSSNKVWAGGVTGGLWYNTDITNSTNSWVHVSGLWSNLSITAIAFDPVNAGVMYVGTGEYFGTGSSRGAGIWKSSDTGKTWSQLSSTTAFYYTNDLVIRKEGSTAVLYAAIDPGYYMGSWQPSGITPYGIMRSTNGGTSWTAVSPNVPVQGSKFAVADLEIGIDNRIWAGTRKNPYSGSDAGGGRILYSDNGTTWSTAYTHTDVTGRVEIACAPSTANYVYALIDGGGKLDAIVNSKDNGQNWTSRAEPADVDNGIPDDDFTRGQAWYDLIAAVSPTDSNTLYIGGVDLFVSTNAGSSGTTWTHISKWSNNNNLSSLPCSYVHADQHAIAFKPGSSSTAVVGNDGGVFYTSNITSGGTSAVFSDRNKGYNVVQFYYGDISQTSGSNKMIAGAQDNGTTYFKTAGVSNPNEINGGDGAASFIHAGGDTRQICAYVYNQYKYTNNSWTNIADLITDGANTNGQFINPAEWDNNVSGLITNKNSGNLYRIKLTTTPGTLETVSYKTSTAEYASALEATKLSNGKTRLYVGTNSGSVLYTDDFWATTPSFTSIGSGINAGGITNIYSHKGTDTVLVTVGNYGGTFKNIYVSTNNGSSWTSKEGNLPDMPVRDILLNPSNVNEAIIATEVGIYGTTNFWATSPTWTAHTAGMGAVRVNQLKYRSSDKTIMAITFGRGVFTSNAWAQLTPIATFAADKTDVCTNTTVSFSDSSLNNPTQWTWTVSPRNMVYMGGTDSTSQNPKIRFTKSGTYNITLQAGNNLGVNSKTRTAYITVSDTQRGVATLSISRSSICAGDTATLYLTPGSDLQKVNLSVNWKKNTNSFATTAYSQTITPASGDNFLVSLTNSHKCATPASFNSNTISPTVNPIVNASAMLQAASGCSGRPLVVAVQGTNTGTNPSWDWYVDNALQLTHTANLTINNPANGSKVYATVNVSGQCIRPKNQIYSDTTTLVVKATPSAPVVSRSFDTMIASNVGTGSYTWFRFGQQVGTSRTHKAAANGVYKCVYTENGCTSDSSAAINFNSLKALQSVFGEFITYPNPAREKFVLEIRNSQNVKQILAYNPKGQMIGLPLQKTGKLFEFNTSNLSAGVYFIQITSTGGQVFSLQFVKE